MAARLVQECPLWFNTAKMRDADDPISQGGISCAPSTQTCWQTAGLRSVQVCVTQWTHCARSGRKENWLHHTGPTRFGSQSSCLCCYVVVKSSMTEPHPLLGPLFGLTHPSVHMSIAWFSRLSHCPETPAWIYAQRSHYSLQGSSGKSESDPLWWGSPSPVSVMCSIHLAYILYLDHTERISADLSSSLFVLKDSRRGRMSQNKEWPTGLVHEAQSIICPLEVRAHFIKGVAAYSTLANDTLVADICKAGDWATLNTFPTFYHLR